MSKPGICLIEPCHSHEEVLFPLIELLRDDYDVAVLAPQSLLNVDLLSRTRGLYRAIPFEWNQRSAKWRRLLSLPGKYLKIRRLVKALRPDFVLFNSTYTWLDLLLIVTLFDFLPKAQIIHEFQVFLRPGMRWFYKQFNLNLVISEEVFESVRRTHPEYAGLDYVLPIFFTGFEAACARATGEESAASGAPMVLGVFGTVDKTRRNYEGLFQSLTAWKQAGRPHCFCVEIVGKLPAEYRALIRERGLEPLVRYSESFVPFEEMFETLRRVDVVLFLIDASVRDCDVYNHLKITGSSTLIKGFRKVCAVSRDFRVDALLADKCLFYEGAQLERLFEDIASGRVNREAIRALETRYERDAILTAGAQRARLVAALARASGRLSDSCKRSRSAAREDAPCE
jgi:hypothetical protein